ncbi:MAG: ribosome maturation factor RimP [Pseudomonadota bacterium]
MEASLVRPFYFPKDFEGWAAGPFFLALSIKTDIEELLAPLVEDLGYEWVGLEYHPHPSNGVLRVYIDQPETGIGLEDCALVSREISGLLDVNDPIKGHYNLEVSSPGMDRPLFSVDQFARFAGQQVKVSLHAPVEGRRKIRGTIGAVEGQTIRLLVDDEAVEIDHADVAKARLVPEF